MKVNILTIFPEAISTYLEASILSRARAKRLLEINLVDIRQFSPDKHQTVDDTPYGGGAGMVMKVEPIHAALKSLQAYPGEKAKKIAVLAARGEQFTQTEAQAYSQLGELTLICGRYEGVDQRVADHLADEEISIGPYVLAGGEIAALAVLEATARLIPGVLGNPDSLAEESFSNPKSSKLPAKSSVEYPHYTKPEEYNGWKVPSILLSGNHAAIKKWRDDHAG